MILRTIVVKIQELKKQQFTVMHFATVLSGGI
jgi:hypothetical protein